MVVTVTAAVGVQTRWAEAQGARDASVRAYYSANGLLNRGMHELAIDEYRTFLEAHPEHEFADTARYGLGVCLYRTNQHANAIAALNEIDDEADGDESFQFAAEVQAILGQCYLARKSYDSAAGCFDQLLERHADHDLADDATALLAESLYNMGEHAAVREASGVLRSRWPGSPHRDRADLFDGLSAMATGEYGDGADVFEALMKRSPDGPYADQSSLLLAQCHHRNNAVARAMKGYRDVIRRGREAYAPTAMHGLSLLLHEEKRLDEADELLTTFMQTYPNDPLAGRARLQHGRVLFDQQQYDEARKRFRQAAKDENGQQDRAAYWTAKCDLRTGRERNAATRLRQAISRYPKSEVLAEMMYDLGVALLRSDQRPEALDAFDAFREKFARHKQAPDALHLAASIEHQDGAYDKSATRCRAFQRAYAEHALRADVDFLLAENQFLSRQYDEAITSFAAFNESHPRDRRGDLAAYRIGLAHFHAGSTDDARDALSAVVKKHADDQAFSFGLYALGDLHFQADESDQAIKYFAAYFALGGDDAVADDALLKYGLSQQRAGQPREALRAFEALIERYPESDHIIHAKFERGQVLVDVDEPEDAERVFSELLSEAPESRFAPHALNHLAAMALADQRYEDAASFYGRIVTRDDATDLHAEAQFHRSQSLMKANKYDDAVRGFTAFIEKHGGHERAAHADAYRAISMARLNQNAEAAAALARVEQEHRTALDASLRTTLLYELAWAHRAQDQHDQAALAYDALLAVGADELLRYHGMAELAELHAEAGENARAIQLIDELRSAQTAARDELPESVMEQSMYRYGVCHHRLKRYKPAVDIFETFMEQYPDSELLASASMLAGDAAFQIKQHRRATQHMNRVVTRFADSDMLGPCLLRLGEASAALQEWEPSQAAYAQFLKAFPQDPMWFQAQFGIGWARENEGRYDDAIAAYRQVVDGHEGKTAARAQFQIGECLFARKDHTEAVRELLKVDIHYAYPEWSAAALYEAGRCFQAMGNPVDARSHYRQVQDRYADSKWAALASTRLEEMKRTTLPGHGSDAR